MRFGAIIAVLILGSLLACTPYPRYRSGGELPPKGEKKYAQEEPMQEPVMLTTTELLEFGRVLQSYLGTPYQGTGDNGRGMDCSEFTGEVFSRYNGTVLPRTSEEQSEVGEEIPKNEVSYGDLVFFRIDGNDISHVGIYIGYGEFIHSSKSSGIVISNLGDDYWKRRFAGARRILGAE